MHPTKLTCDYLGRQALPALERANLPVIQPELAIHPCSKRHVVRGDQRRQAAPPHQRHKCIKNLIGRGRIKIARRFIRKKQARTVR